MKKPAKLEDVEKRLRYTIIALSVLCVLFLGSTLFLYTSLTGKLTQEVTTMEREVLDTIVANQMQDQIAREILQTTIDQRFHEVSSSLTMRIDETQQELESQVSGVASEVQILDSRTDGISEQVADVAAQSNTLETRISQISVSGSDFSAVAQEAVKAVVSVQTSQGVGSGVIVDRSGTVITNEHVVSDNDVVLVIGYDGKRYNADVVGVSRVADIAVLQIRSEDEFDRLRLTESVNIGERVIAIGNPRGLDFSVSEGIVSAVNRRIDRTGIGYIQTDVPINPGNSGGPLVNAEGRVIGINTLKLSNSEGLGFALPTEIVEIVLNQLES